jgi:hypothetical protein
MLTFGTDFGPIVSVELIQKLLEAQAMSFEFHRLPRHWNNNAATNFVNATANTVFPVLRSLSVKGEMRANLTTSILNSFPNLVKLELGCDYIGPCPVVLDAVVTDEVLQSIILNLVNLQTLILSLCDKITDFGVSGIRCADVRQLLESKSLYLERDLTELGMDRIGLPLSDLKGTKLHGKPQQIYYIWTGVSSLRSTVQNALELGSHPGTKDVSTQKLCRNSGLYVNAAKFSTQLSILTSEFTYKARIYFVFDFRASLISHKAKSLIIKVPA